MPHDLTDQLTNATMIGLRDAVADHSLSAVELTQAYLDRIEQHDPSLEAFHEVHADRALKRAAEVDAGQRTGPLAGVPIAVKDLFCTDYGTTTASSKMLEHHRSPFTATAVQRLEDAGAIVLGKTNMDEFAMGSSGETCAFAQPKNPWDLQRVPGGSSAGSAAAVAADLCAASLGSDTGGSIRQPAAFCGVVGLKPTYGRISRSGMVAFASSLDQCGPFTRTVADAALLTKLMAGLDPLDGTTAPVSVEPDFDDVTQPVNHLRIGVAKQYMAQGANDPAVQQATDDAIRFYEQQGATIVQVDLPHTQYGIPVYYVVATAECSSNLARYDGVHFGHRTADPVQDIVELFAKSRAEGFGDEVKRRVMLGTYALSAGYADQYYNRALAVRRLIKQDFDHAFAQCDAILCPTTTGPAFKFGDKSDDPLAMYLNDVYTVNANLAGIAGISLPAGTAHVDGQPLPVGIQLLGDAFAEAKLFRIAHQYEVAHPFAAMRPTL